MSTCAAITTEAVAKGIECDLIDQAITDAVDANRFPGATWAVGVGGQLLKSGAVGLASIKQVTPMSEASIFRLMSMTKPVATVAAMQLVEQGMLDLDQTAKEFLPGLSLWHDKRAERITLRHLLTHSSGIQEDGNDNLAPSPLLPPISLEQRVSAMSDLQFSAEPGRQFSYSPFSGFDLLARIIELTARTPFDQYLQAAIFDPLGMHDTGFDLSPARRKRLVTLYSSESDRLISQPFDDGPSYYRSGSVGLYGSVHDYLKFAMMLAGDGELAGIQVLRPASVRQIDGEQLPSGFPGMDKPGLSWGLGVRRIVDPAKARSVLPEGSYGWSGAYGTHVRIVPSLGLAAVLMSNVTTAGGAEDPIVDDFERLLMSVVRHEKHHFNQPRSQSWNPECERTGARAESQES
jgi:CubicO group peptidase (beta-lactamase class C family)